MRKAKVKAVFRVKRSQQFSGLDLSNGKEAAAAIEIGLVTYSSTQSQ